MPVERLVLAARAKINLALDVLFKRPDGYHEVAMVMQSLALADKVTLTADRALSVVSTAPDLECGPSNLAYRAAALLRERCGVDRGVRIALEKNIPLAAGLAGGSADAAAVLRGLNRLWGLGLTLSELEGVGAALGSDVPFCLRGGTVLATGRGEALRSLPALPHAWIVLAKPPVAVSTAWVYGNYRGERVTLRPDVAGMESCLAAGDLNGVTARLANVLETVTVPAHPAVAALKAAMLEHGARASLMSGSGPTVFGIADNLRQAEKIAAALRSSTDAWVTVTETAGELEGEDGTTVAADQA
ncbi:4-(cytidine 5'-diphospho)-2-C-methyl-D-erythritol kinase [Anaeroselena agilis]|uniref:4-diphosphocytidyl-2-C-methyl-D-erythritol kinase n=1 Tax=Anaeroselena agilis TaxID=3063788 RepID=A0ABU3P3T3_9FIRM|nr:4-(cytidine 5'-diphospho)-2-C-methyl-D-erythritol kinase [Selenomonadales bacterium 4137-cl]